MDLALIDKAWQVWWFPTSAAQEVIGKGFESQTLDLVIFSNMMVFEGSDGIFKLDDQVMLTISGSFTKKENGPFYVKQVKNIIILCSLWCHK